MEGEVATTGARVGGGYNSVPDHSESLSSVDRRALHEREEEGSRNEYIVGGSCSFCCYEVTHGRAVVALGVVY